MLTASKRQHPEDFIQAKLLHYMKAIHLDYMLMTGLTAGGG